jgi:hypothetical protein
MNMDILLDMRGYPFGSPNGYPNGSPNGQDTYQWKISKASGYERISPDMSGCDRISKHICRVQVPRLLTREK